MKIVHVILLLATMLSLSAYATAVAVHDTIDTYFSHPLSSRLALGTKLLVGSSIMDDIEYTTNYRPFIFLEDFAPDMVGRMIEVGFNITQTMTSNAHKHLHQWGLGCALCV